MKESIKTREVTLLHRRLLLARREVDAEAINLFENRVPIQADRPKYQLVIDQSGLNRSAVDSVASWKLHKLPTQKLEDFKFD